jgi:succinate dehydrogenase/fumarate reductase flavoprotein subunit
MAAVFPASQAIVLGGGLAGVTAANTVLEYGGKVVLLDKSAFCGGNSTKATCGISAVNSRRQRIDDIYDSAEAFKRDTGAKKPEIVEVLCKNSGADVAWLVEKFGLDLSVVSRLGGHSEPRVHRGAERFPGMTITYALIQMLEKIADNTDAHASSVKEGP